MNLGEEEEVKEKPRILQASDQVKEPEEEFFLAGDGDGAKKKSPEDRLRDAASVCITNPTVVNLLVNYEPSDPTETHPSPIFKILVTDMCYMWFDLFRALGVDHKVLEGIDQRYQLDADACLFEAIGEWLRTGHPANPDAAADVAAPSWKALVDVLRSKLMEAKLADTIAEKHFSPQQREDYKKVKAKLLGNEVIPPGFEDDEAEFSKLLLEIVDQLGPDCFPELSFFLKGLHCPDGTRFVDQSYIKEQRSPEGLLIPLLYNNLLVSQDLDVLVAIVSGLGREDLMPLLEGYLAKVIIGYPIFKGIQDTDNFFSLLVGLQPEVTDLDLEGVFYIKREVCEILGVAKVPYMLQFLGWKNDASVVVQFQVHFSLADRVREVVLDLAARDLENFNFFEVEIRGCTLHYDLDRASREKELLATCPAP